MNKHEKLCYTAAELCDILPVGRNSIYKLLQEGSIKSLRVGKKILIPIDNVHQFLEEQCR